jgi:hypothetical protein
MSKPRTLDRRQFTTEAALAMLSGVAITISGCGGSSPTAPSGGGGSGTPPTNGVSGSISANHGHVASISQSQLDAGADFTLDIRGSSDHAHSIDLSGSQLSQIAGGQRVSVTSTNNDGHSHTVTFN